MATQKIKTNKKMHAQVDERARGVEESDDSGDAVSGDIFVPDDLPLDNPVAMQNSLEAIITAIRTAVPRHFGCCVVTSAAPAAALSLSLSDSPLLWFIYYF